jgi:hypothetical protein
LGIRVRTGQVRGDQLGGEGRRKRFAVYKANADGKVVLIEVLRTGYAMRPAALR